MENCVQKQLCGKKQPLRGIILWDFQAICCDVMFSSNAYHRCVTPYEWSLHIAKRQTILQNTHQTFRNADNSRFHTNLDTSAGWQCSMYNSVEDNDNDDDGEKTTTLAESHSTDVRVYGRCHTNSFVEKIFTRYRFVSCTVIVKEWTLSLAVEPRTHPLCSLHQHCVENLLTSRDEKLKEEKNRLIFNRDMSLIEPVKSV